MFVIVNFILALGCLLYFIVELLSPREDHKSYRTSFLVYLIIAGLGFLNVGLKSITVQDLREENQELKDYNTELFDELYGTNAAKNMPNGIYAPED